MTVKELIEKLKNCNPNDKVFYADYANGDQETIALMKLADTDNVNNGKDYVVLI